MIEASADLLKIVWVLMLGIVAKAEAAAREYDDYDDGDDDNDIK